MNEKKLKLTERFYLPLLYLLKEPVYRSIIALRAKYDIVDCEAEYRAYKANTAHYWDGFKGKNIYADILKLMHKYNIPEPFFASTQLLIFFDNIKLTTRMPLAINYANDNAGVKYLTLTIYPHTTQKEIDEVMNRTVKPFISKKKIKYPPINLKHFEWYLTDLKRRFEGKKLTDYIGKGEAVDARRRIGEIKDLVENT